MLLASAAVQGVGCPLVSPGSPLRHHLAEQQSLSTSYSKTHHHFSFLSLRKPPCFYALCGLWHARGQREVAASCGVKPMASPFSFGWRGSSAASSPTAFAFLSPRLPPYS